MESTDFRVWIAPLDADVRGTTVSLSYGGGSQYMLDRLSRKLGETIRKAAAEALGCDIQAVELRFMKPLPQKSAMPAAPETAKASKTAERADTRESDADRPEPASGLILPGTRPAPAIVTASEPRTARLPLTSESGDPLVHSQKRKASVVHVHDAPRREGCAAEPQAPTAKLVQQSLMGAVPLNQPLTASARILQEKRWRYSFEDFVVGSSNQMAAVAAKELCRAKSDIETLFVGAGAGLGKTHIAQSVGREITLARGGNAHVAYLTADEFFSRFRMGILSKNLDSFSDRLKGLDFLLLEDVQFLHGKHQTQEFLYSVVKHLQSQGSRVAFTSNCGVNDLKILDSQLVSLICSGIIARMDRPDYTLRKEILLRKACVHQVLLPEDVADLLATRLTGDVRQIESCLQTLLLKVRIMNAPIDRRMALDVLKQFELEADEAQKLISFDEILHFVAHGFNLTEKQVRSRVRRREYVHARNVLYYLARKHTELTLQEIGRRLGKTHSTVLKGIATIEQLLGTDTGEGRQVNHIIGSIESRAGVARVGA